MDINSLSPLLSSPSLDRARVCQSLLAFTPSPNVNIYGRKRKEGRDGQSVSQARFGPLATFTTRARGDIITPKMQPISIHLSVVVVVVDGGTDSDG